MFEEAVTAILGNLLTDVPLALIVLYMYQRCERRWELEKETSQEQNKQIMTLLNKFVEKGFDDSNGR